MRIIPLLLVLSPLLADAPRSGLEIGKRPGPYSSLVVVGPERGSQHCFICEAENRPIVVVFARDASEPLGKLAHRLDGLFKKQSESRGWITFLAADAGPLEPKLIAWSRKHATGSVPITIFEDVVGPPTYRLAADTDVTVIVAENRKVTANFAYRAGELNDAAIETIMKAATARPAP